MKTRWLSFLAVLSVTTCVARAQQPDSDVLAPYLRRSYVALTKDMLAATEMMPETGFDFRPAGVATEVRTFGEIVAHAATVTDFSCAMGDGKPGTLSALDSTLTRDKARLLALLKAVDARCTVYLATLTDATLSQRITTGTSPRMLQSTRGASMFFAIAHGNEHYGNLVTYLRAKGLVPPPTAAQASFLSLVAPPKP